MRDCCQQKNYILFAIFESYSLITFAGQITGTTPPIPGMFPNMFPLGTGQVCITLCATCIRFCLLICIEFISLFICSSLVLSLLCQFRLWLNRLAGLHRYSFFHALFVIIFGLIICFILWSQATRHARRVYVGGLPPTANEQVFVRLPFFSHIYTTLFK